MKTSSWGLLLWVGIAAAVLVGCSKKEESAPAPGAEDSLKPASAHDSTRGAAPAMTGGLKFTAPSGWISEKPSNNMRQAQYRLPRVEGDTEDAEMVVYYFQGGGGGVQANIDRWIGQFTKADGSPVGDLAKTSRKTVNGIQVSLVDVSGTYSGAMSPMGGSSEPKTNYRMLGAVAEAASGPWFFKLTGPVKTVTKWQSSFDSFIDTIQQ